PVHCTHLPPPERHALGVGVRRSQGPSWRQSRRSAGMANVDLELSDDQELLRATTARYIESTMPLTKVRELADSGASAGDDYLRGGGELGWFAMLVPEEHGGGSASGAGVLDAVVLAEERGRFLQPGPFVPNNVVAYALAASGSRLQRL